MRKILLSLHGCLARGKRPVACLGAGLALLALTPSAYADAAAPPAPEPVKPVREIIVPFDDLHILLEAGPRRVLLTREQYEELLQKAEKVIDAAAPVPALIASADYTVKSGEDRAEIEGLISLTVLEDGVHVLGLDVAGVGLRSVMLDGKGAPLGRADDGRLQLFVEGKGTHELTIDAVAPLETTAARQILNFRLPTPAATRLRLTVPGDVEVRSGAAVAARVFDEQRNQTRFELIPEPDAVPLVMSLNSRLKRQDRVVVARSVYVSEVTRAFERLHAAVSFAILHRAIDNIRMRIPAGFEVTDVHSPNLAQWTVSETAGSRILEARLREESVGTVVLTVGALKTEPDLAPWQFPQLEPLDVAGHSAVVGLLAEERLEARDIAAAGLIPIDTSVIMQALPDTVVEADPHAAVLRPVAAYFAPQAGFTLSAHLHLPPAKLRVTSGVLLTISDSGLAMRGGFAMLPELDKCFAIDFSVPPGWDVTEITGENEEALAFERYAADPDGPARINVRLPKGVPAGSEGRFFFEALHVPDGWLDPWDSRQVSFPVFAVQNVTRDVGCIAVDARDDMQTRPVELERLTPLDENDKAEYGLGGLESDLAYRYDAQPYRAELVVERTEPRLTAETYSFFRVERDSLVAHYEIIYNIDQARARQVALLLPGDTPAALAIRGLQKVNVKEYTSEDTAEGRRWTALLAEARSGTVRIAVDFRQPVSLTQMEEFPLPLIRAADVAYQSGLVAVEGNAELDVRVTEHPRKVDIGELVEAEYLPGRRLLGAFGFVGTPPPMGLAVKRHALSRLPPTVVQRVELATLLSAKGVAQSAARFLMRTKALFLRIALPKGATLWSVMLDGKPAKPQQQGDSVLLGLQAGDDGRALDLEVVYEMPVSELGLRRRLQMPAPRLYLHETADGPGREMPVADLQWHLYTPTGYRVVGGRGTVTAHGLDELQLAAVRLPQHLHRIGGGVDFSQGLIALALARPTAMCVGVALVAAIVTIVLGIVRTRRKREISWARWLMTAAVVGAILVILAGMMLPSLSQSREKARRVRAAADGRQLGMAVTEAEPRPSAAAPAGGAVQRPGRQRREPRRKPPSWALEGARSLRIQLVRMGRAVTFRSLGSEPRLEVCIVNRRRVDALAWSLALAVFVAGLALTPQRASRKAALVAGAMLVATLLPCVPGLLGLTLVLNGVFYAACVLIVYYPAAGVVARAARSRRMRDLGTAPVRAATALLAFGVLLFSTLPRAAAQEQNNGTAPYVIQVVPPPDPVQIPEDAIIVPYDPDAETRPEHAARIMIPYDRFEELWTLANKDLTRERQEPHAPYALAGASLTGTLQGDEFLLLEGHIDIEVYTDGSAEIPLRLEGGVLARADLDGKPARLHLVMPAPEPAQQAQKASVDAPQALTLLYISGKGRHRLDLAIRMRLRRRGGWRLAAGRLPVAQAATLALTVPEADTEVRLGGVSDRRSYEIAQAGEVIRTAVDAAEPLSVEWRPKVGQGRLDRTLTAESTALLDIREDRLRLVWAVKLDLRRSEREFFSLELPKDYLVEKVDGTNVRGWELRAAADPAAGRPRLEVGLLKRSKEMESLSVHLWRPGPVPAAQVEMLDVPCVGVTDAMRHTGSLTVRRSPLLDVRTSETDGVRRTDLPETAAEPDGVAEWESPLGIRPFQAYEFAAVPFRVRLEVTPVAPETAAALQTILRITEREQSIESRILLSVKARPLYRARVLVPEKLEVDSVSAPGTFDWVLVQRQGRQLLTVTFNAGVQGEIPILLTGHIPKAPDADELSLVQLEVLGVERQEGDIVVQAEPSLNVEVRDLRNIEAILLRRVHSWLVARQRPLARQAFHYKDPDYSGRVILTPRMADVSCYTATNVRVTDRTIEETIMIDFTIRTAGIREIRFELPTSMADAKISVPLLRQKTLTAAENADTVNVTLELQEEVMNQLRVLVENDRLLTAEPYDVPIPAVQTGRTDRRYVAVESAGRDEVVTDEPEGLEPLSRQQREWQAVASLLRGGTTQAFIVSPAADRPRLTLRIRQRATVETAGARIGLGQALVIVDANGSYRAQQTYHIDNRTEQFLKVELPEGAALWTVQVAGESVKPAFAGAATAREIRFPLVKTAGGDLDYTVVFKYSGNGLDLDRQRRLRFPLARATNINVEQSQVELRLPSTHKWMRFAGNMRHVTEAGEFEAGLVAYQNKLAERLVQTLQFGNAFEQARAIGNLKNVTRQLSSSNDALANFRSNTRAITQLDQSKALLQKASKQLDQAGKTILQSDTSVRDNRHGFNVAFDGQDWGAAPEAIRAAGSNFGNIVFDGDRAQNVNNFNADWLESNTLQVRTEVEKKARKRVRASNAWKTPEKAEKDGAAFEGEAVAAQRQTAAIAKGLARQKARKQKIRPAPKPPVAAQPKQRRSQKELAVKYQRELQEQADLQVAQVQGLQLQQQAVSVVRRGGAVTAGGPAGPAGPGAPGVPARPADVAVDVQAAPTGLLSLDVELPAMDGSRWALYRFTTPRGDVEITARAMARKRMSALKRLAVALGLTLILLALGWAFRRGALRPVSNRFVSNLLLIFGIAGLLTGVFPIAALAAAAIGVALKTVLRAPAYASA